MNFPVFVTVHPGRQSSTFRRTLASGVQIEFAKNTPHSISEDDFASIAKDIGASLALCSEDGNPDLEATGSLVLHIAGEILSYSEETNKPASLPYHQVEALKEFQAQENAELDAEEDQIELESESSEPAGQAPDQPIEVFEKLESPESLDQAQENAELDAEEDQIELESESSEPAGQAPDQPIEVFEKLESPESLETASPRRNNRRKQAK